MRFHRRADFMIIEVAGPSMPGVAGRRSKSAWRAVEQDRQPHCAALRQPDATAVVFAGELQLNATVPCLRGKASSNVPRPGDQASASSGLPPNIQHMMSKVRSRERWTAPARARTVSSSRTRASSLVSWQRRSRHHVWSFRGLLSTFFRWLS